MLIGTKTISEASSMSACLQFADSNPTVSKSEKCHKRASGAARQASIVEAGRHL